jgi:hypothetical protein
VIGSLTASAVTAHLPGTLAVRPGRDRARPARAARSVVVPVTRHVTTALPAGARRRSRRLDPIETNSATHACDAL